MIPKMKTRSARIQHRGRLIEFGRRPPAEARRIEEDARERLARGERLVGVQSIRPARGSIIHAYDAELWMESGDVEEMTGPQKLMLGVLEDAKQKLRSRHADEVREATRWILSDDRSHICAFATICEAFGVEPAEIRRALLKGALK